MSLKQKKVTVEELFDQLVANVPNQAVEVSDKSNVYQCMDWAYLWVFILGFPKATIQRLYAYEVFAKANEITKEYFEVISNSASFVPQKGDLGIFDKGVVSGNIAGHICVCTGEGDTKTFKSYDQNWSGTGVKLIQHNYNKFLGVLRPRRFSFEHVVIDWDDAEKNRHEVGWYVYEWHEEKKKVNSLLLENRELVLEMDKLRKENESLRITNAKLAAENTDITGKNIALMNEAQFYKNQMEDMKVNADEIQTKIEGLLKENKKCTDSLANCKEESLKNLTLKDIFSLIASKIGKKE